MFYPSQGIKKEPFFMAQHYQFIRKQITCQWFHESSLVYTVITLRILFKLRT